MYRDEILDLYKHPRNTGEIEDADLEAEAENPSCGDETHITLKTEDGAIEEIRHETDGCAISTAAISIVSEELRGTSIEEVKDLDDEWMVEQLGVDISPMRMKCAMLGLNTIKEIVQE